MRAKLYYNKSDKRCINKDIEFIPPHVDEGQPTPTYIDVEFIQDSSIIDPRLIVSARVNSLQANYLFLEDLTRYYYINNQTLADGRIILECHVDVLMSFRDFINQKDIIAEKLSRQPYNLYLNDPDMQLNNYSSFETLELNPTGSMYFDDNTEQLVMVCSGNQ